MDLPGFFSGVGFVQKNTGNPPSEEEGFRLRYQFRGSKNYGVQVGAAPDQVKKATKNIYTRETPYTTTTRTASRRFNSSLSSLFLP